MSTEKENVSKKEIKQKNNKKETKKNFIIKWCIRLMIIPVIFFIIRILIIGVIILILMNPLLLMKKIVEDTKKNIEEEAPIETIIASISEPVKQAVQQAVIQVNGGESPPVADATPYPSTHYPELVKHDTNCKSNRNYSSETAIKDSTNAMRWSNYTIQGVTYHDIDYSKFWNRGSGDGSFLYGNNNKNYKCGDEKNNFTAGNDNLFRNTTPFTLNDVEVYKFPTGQEIKTVDGRMCIAPRVAWGIEWTPMYENAYKTMYQGTNYQPDDAHPSYTYHNPQFGGFNTTSLLFRYFDIVLEDMENGNQQFVIPCIGVDSSWVSHIGSTGVKESTSPQFYNNFYSNNQITTTSPATDRVTWITKPKGTMQYTLIFTDKATGNHDLNELITGKKSIIEDSAQKINNPEEYFLNKYVIQNSYTSPNGNVFNKNDIKCSVVETATLEDVVESYPSENDVIDLAGMTVIEVYGFDKSDNFQARMRASITNDVNKYASGVSHKLRVVSVRAYDKVMDANSKTWWKENFGSKAQSGTIKSTNKVVKYCGSECKCSITCQKGENGH